MKKYVLWNIDGKELQIYLNNIFRTFIFLLKKYISDMMFSRVILVDLDNEN